MKIVSFLENTTDRDDVAIEHGLSLYIETQRHKRFPLMRPTFIPVTVPDGHHTNS